eukprot:scaffold98325_cov60-Phaeocystis_antarctica.AAC.2
MPWARAALKHASAVWISMQLLRTPQLASPLLSTSIGGVWVHVIVIVLTELQSADHSPANRNDCPDPMVTDCVETVISLLIVDPDSGCMVPPLGPTVQPDELPPKSGSPVPISTR